MATQRLITLDTETTGLEAQGGDRIIEIGCVALDGRLLTNRPEDRLQLYINPGVKSLRTPSKSTASRTSSSRTSRNSPRSSISSSRL